MIIKQITGVHSPALVPELGITEPVWIIDRIDEDTVLRCYVFPKSTFVYRAAEYGIDPTDADTLLDVILCEHYMNLVPGGPPFLYSTDETSARSAHLARVVAVKKTVAHTDPLGLLPGLKNTYLASINLPLLAAHRAAVGQLRSRRIRALAGALPNG